MEGKDSNNLEVLGGFDVVSILVWMLEQSCLQVCHSKVWVGTISVCLDISKVSIT